MDFLKELAKGFTDFERMASKGKLLSMHDLNQRAFRNWQKYRDAVLRTFDKKGWVRVELYKRVGHGKNRHWNLNRNVLVKVAKKKVKLTEDSKDVLMVEKVLKKKLSRTVGFAFGDIFDKNWWECL